MGGALPPPSPVPAECPKGPSNHQLLPPSTRCSAGANKSTRHAAPKCRHDPSDMPNFSGGGRLLTHADVGFVGGARLDQQIGPSRHVHRPTQNLRDSRNRALACMSGAFRAVAWYSLNYVQQLIKRKEYHAGALWSLSAYWLKPHPVLRIFLYGPEHTVFLSLRSVFLCAIKSRTRLLPTPSVGTLRVFERVRLASLSVATSYSFEKGSDRLTSLSVVTSFSSFGSRRLYRQAKDLRR